MTEREQQSVYHACLLAAILLGERLRELSWFGASQRGGTPS